MATDYVTVRRGRVDIVWAILTTPENQLPAHGDPFALRAAAALRARLAIEGDPFVGPAKVPELVGRRCDVSEAPTGLRRLHARAVERGWTAVVTHGRGWGLTRGKPGARLLDSYALRLRIDSTDGRSMRAYGVWVNGQAQDGGWLELPSRMGGRFGIARLGEVINSVEIR